MLDVDCRDISFGGLDLFIRDAEFRPQSLKVVFGVGKDGFHEEWVAEIECRDPRVGVRPQIDEVQYAIESVRCASGRMGNAQLGQSVVERSFESVAMPF